MDASGEDFAREAEDWLKGDEDKGQDQFGQEQDGPLPPEIRLEVVDGGLASGRRVLALAVVLMSLDACTYISPVYLFVCVMPPVSLAPINESINHMLASPGLFI